MSRSRGERLHRQARQHRSVALARASLVAALMPLSPQVMDTPTSILLVDDDPKNLLVLETILNSADYALVKALSAEEALLALMQREFAVIVLDVQMPEMNGIELARLIKHRKKTQHVPILFL